MTDLMTPCEVTGDTEPDNMTVAMDTAQGPSNVRPTDNIDGQAEQSAWTPNRLVATHANLIP